VRPQVQAAGAIRALSLVDKVPQRSAAHRTAPHRTAPQRSAAHRLSTDGLGGRSRQSGGWSSPWGSPSGPPVRQGKAYHSGHRVGALLSAGHGPGALSAASAVRVAGGTSSAPSASARARSLACACLCALACVLVCARARVIARASMRARAKQPAQVRSACQAALDGMRISSAEQFAHAVRALADPVRHCGSGYPNR
jgi:hypothetical protein